MPIFALFFCGSGLAEALRFPFVLNLFENMVDELYKRDSIECDLTTRVVEGQGNAECFRKARMGTFTAPELRRQRIERSQ